MKETMASNPFKNAIEDFKTQISPYTELAASFKNIVNDDKGVESLPRAATPA